MITADLHTHSTLSHDGYNTIDEMCRSAIRRGITHLAITEHVDDRYCHPITGFFNPETYRTMMDRAHEKYPELTLLKGVEFGEPHTSSETFAYMSTLDLDVIIGSLHRPAGIPLTNSTYTCESHPDEVFSLYFTELCQMDSAGGFDILGHLDLPVRYIQPSYSISTMLEELLSLCIDHSIIPEINTSTLRMGFEEAMPSDEVLALYTDLGGTHITCGSDAHYAKHIGSGFDQISQKIRRFNLMPVYFKNRTMIELPLECVA